MLSYLTAMGIRLYYMRQLLKDSGSLYYHCDTVASHYIKIVLDYIFGINNFRNEITWKRNFMKGGKAMSKQMGNNADIIFYYSKSELTEYNTQYINYTEDYIKKIFKYDDNDGRGLYQSQPIGTRSVESIKRLREDNRIITTSTGGERLKMYLSEMKGVALDNIWTDINCVSLPGYPTQKPEDLLERIIKASSNENDLVMDFYNGGGTTGAVCKKLNRNYLGVDINYRAIQITKERLEKLGSVIKEDLIIYGIPRSLSELHQLVELNILGTAKNSRFDLEEVTVKYYLKNVVGNECKVNDSSIDGTFGFEYNGKKCKGLVQVTSGSNKNHLKAFCSEISKGTGDLGVYICFKSNVTDGFIQEVKSYGKIGNVDKIQILTFEELIDENKQYKIPE